LTRERELDAIPDPDHDTETVEGVVIQVKSRVVRIRADLVARAIAPDHRPGRQPASRRTFHLAHAAGQQQLAAQARWVEIGELLRVEFTRLGRGIGWVGVVRDLGVDELRRRDLQQAGHEQHRGARHACVLTAD
jgi:hypothetical protein